MIIPGLSLELGGTTTLSIGFFHHLQLHADIKILTIHKNEAELEGADPDMLNDTRIKSFLSISNYYNYSGSFIREVRKIVQEVDLVHIHGLWHGAAYPSARVAIRAGVPFIVSPHGMLEADAFQRNGWKKKLFWGLLWKKVFKRAAAVHCTAKSEIENTYKFDPNARVIYVPNGIYLPRQTKIKEANHLLFIGRLHPKKAVDRILKAVKEVIRDYPNLKVCIAGTGAPEYEKSLKQLCKQLNLQNQISFVGFTTGSAKDQLFLGAKIALVPSFSEGLPLAALEAMSYGVPLLITKSSNVPEVTEFDCGLEIENNDPKTIAIGMKRLLNSNLNLLGDNARKVAAEKFQWKIVASQLYEAYEKVVKSNL